MLWVIVLALGGLVLVLVSCLWSISRQVRQVLDAAQVRQPLLVERRDGLIRAFRIDQLQVAVNHLISENRRRSRTEKGYLDQIQTTLGSMREAVLIVNPDNYIVLANDALRGLLRTAEPPLGRRLESVIQGSDFYEYVRQVKSGGSSAFFILEVTIGRQTLWFEITGSRLPEQEDLPGPLTLFVLHDITNQKRLERIRTEFVANVSHELRTPVTIIKGFADTLIEDAEELSREERQRFLLKIQKNVVRLHQMLEELLTLSRLESNPDAMNRERLSLSRVVSEASENFLMRLEPASQTLTLDLTEESDEVLLDPLRISQVVENLLENALRHARGLRTLVIRTRVAAPNVICEVSDDGAGIPAKDLPHIFERFYRVDKGRSRESGGTGLGLSIVKHIVQQHGGEVAAESVMGEGTTIRFTVPFPETLAERAVLSHVRDRARAGRASVRTGSAN